MLQTIELIEPYFVGFALLFWEAFVGWCLWGSIRTDVGLHRGRPISEGHLDTLNRALIREDRPARERAPYVPATSA
jgi:hypothetical protein